MTNKTNKKTSKVISASILSIALLSGSIGVMNTQMAYAITLGSIWGIESSFGVATITEHDAVTNALLTSFSANPVNGPGDCNGRGIASDGQNLWYTCLINGFSGEGLIHKISTSGGADITTIPDPYGVNGVGIGALDWGSITNTLWAIDYDFTNGKGRGPVHEVTQINPADGTVLARCDVPNADGSGTETLAVDEANGVFYTNGAEPTIASVTQYQIPVTNIAGTPCTPGPVFPTPIVIGGIDFDAAGNLINSDVIFAGSFYTDLGPVPFNIINVQHPGHVNVEDITYVPLNLVDVEKSWTHTDYNWDQVCDGFVNATGFCVVSDVDNTEIGFRPANINTPEDDVLADALDQDGDDKYLAYAQVHKEKFSNTNPGAFYALTTVEITTDVDSLTVSEEYGDCYENQGLIQFVSNKETRNIKVAVADPNGDITELSDDIYDGIAGSITSIDDESAQIEITDSSYLTEGSTVYVLVKFQDDLKNASAPGDVFDEMCDNVEEVTANIGGFTEVESAQAALRITNQE